jgi:predicted metallopeptidase
VRLFWQRYGRTVEPRRAASTKTQELETAKEILAEVFHIRPADVEEMLSERLEEQSRHQECQVVLWPATFCLDE